MWRFPLYTGLCGFDLTTIYCHNIPTHTPQSGYLGVTEVAKTANIAKTAEKCINYISARPTPPHTNPMEWGPGKNFRLKIEKNQRIIDFRPKKWGVVFSTVLTTPPHPHPPLLPP